MEPPESSSSPERSWSRRRNSWTSEQMLLTMYVCIYKTILMLFVSGDCIPFESRTDSSKQPRSPSSTCPASLTQVSTYVCMFMYVCTCVCMYIYTVCIYVYVCMFMYVCRCVCMYLYTVCMYVCMYADVYVCIYIQYVCMYFMYVFMNVCMYV